MNKKVYIVHCIDTEGPLYEGLEDTFLRLKEIFGINLEPSIENLKRLQNKEINLEGNEDLVADAFAEKRISTLGSWEKIDEVLKLLMDTSFRERIKDSKGRGWVYNWFCLDHVGFTGNNPRRRDSGFGKIYRHYLDKLKEENAMDQDLLQFHYHPLPFNGHYHYCGTAYLTSSNIYEILAHRIIDDEMFPAAFRAGMEAERPDSHWFLEQWIPFDYSNDSYFKDNEERQPDLRNGRYGDWRHSSMRWRPYHPSHDDYQAEGACHRMITRCISLDSRVAKLEKEDVREAFKQARQGENAILAFANHDFRDMREEVNMAMDYISEVSKEFPDIDFEYADAISAFVKTEGIVKEEIQLDISCDVNLEKDVTLIKIQCKGNHFGTQPYFCFKTKEGKYYWDNLDYGVIKGTWTYAFDDKTFNWSNIDIIGVATNSYAGETEIIRYYAKEDRYEKAIKYGQRVMCKESK